MTRTAAPNPGRDGLYGTVVREPRVRAGSGRGRMAARVCVLAAVGFALAGCGGDTSDNGDTSSSGGSLEQGDQRHPDIAEVEIESGSGGTYDLTVTVSSPYDTPERYADGWRVTAPDGTVYGEHELGHDHRNEQPFTRTQPGVEIPEDVDEVEVEGRDSEYGYGGGTETVEVP